MNGTPGSLVEPGKARLRASESAHPLMRHLVNEKTPFRSGLVATNGER
jgi:hypothetical protein